MSVIEISHLTKDYGHERGVFDVNARVEKGECFGFLGPNGAGKSTTIRHLMGFIKPQKGTTKIHDLDTWKESSRLQNMVGYLPGEIALPSGMTGTEFLKQQMKMRGMKDDRFLNELLIMFELDANINLKQMSLGMKRKLAVVTAFMHDPEILILDEPTSGLDPIMQKTFIEFILQEKKRGKTIFLSSHIFHEVDACCDRIAIIRDGKIVSEFDPVKLKETADKIYRVTFASPDDLEKFCKCDYSIVSKNVQKTRVRVQLKAKQLTEFLKDITDYNVVDFHEFPHSLEDYFMHFYREEKIFSGVR